MITDDEILRTVRLLGQLAVQMNRPNGMARQYAYEEFELLQTALEKDLAEREDDSFRGAVNANSFNMDDGKHLVLSESGVTQHHCGVMAVAECLRNEKSSLMCEVIDTMRKEAE